jgi:lipopolysaccharide/colanic/teichoic acid biosynthesis glycosyltransferase
MTGTIGRVGYRVKRILRIGVGAILAIILLLVLSPVAALFKVFVIGAVIVDASLTAFNKQPFAIVRARNLYRSFKWWLIQNVKWLATDRGEPMAAPRLKNRADR